MKIENNGAVPPSSQAIEALKRAEKKETPKKESQSIHTGQDTIQMSEEGRLLAKAHSALSNADEADTQRLEALRKQIESGDYTVQVADLARKLLSKYGAHKTE